MGDLIELTDENVPSAYLEDPMPEVQTEYGVRLYTKSAPDEKEIAQIFMPGDPKEVRIGWLIPLLSIISSEHDEYENKFFRKHAYEALKTLKGRNLPENLYLLIYSRRLLDSVRVSCDGELALAFLLYGVYPFYEHGSLSSVDFKAPITPKIVIHKCFNGDRAMGFFKLLIREVLPAEKNGYARFMFFYQIYEITMELVFYKKVNELKIKRSHLGIIRKRIDEYSSESKLIGLLYSEMKREEFDARLAAEARLIFEDIKENEYYTSTSKSKMIYDIRNTLVHSYYRFKFKDSLSYLTSYLEDEAFHLLRYLYSAEGLKTEIERTYFGDIA
ncbi:hypothetical protein HG264_14345 [Pseudomonas sp. gcc21]|uniref:hypothetical protein n=1 Tax=Pseudomonas sp. gcc21 TaxID=2726989 RepID=UPI0014519F2B|nr:hypothetical protein [Pseudomonas sp. gcc21]QJD59991.1 hypothetical protein HG264_14345 [Pseudomonas sp. gcc21]